MNESITTTPEALLSEIFGEQPQEMEAQASERESEQEEIDGAIAVAALMASIALSIAAGRAHDVLIAAADERGKDDAAVKYAVDIFEAAGEALPENPSPQGALAVAKIAISVLDALADATEGPESDED